jgi:signal transduction histidine kinase
MAKEVKTSEAEAAAAGRQEQLPSSHDGGATAAPGVVASGSRLQTLSAEVVNLLHEQAFAPGEGRSESDICESFSDILLRHWDLCCIITFLRGEGGRLRQSASYMHPHLDTEKARRVGELLVEEVERTRAECYVWADESREEEADGSTRGQIDALRQANLRAGVASPIFAHGTLAGVLVVVSSHPDRLRSALKGIRFIGPAIIIAIGNARRGAAMSGQHRQIESLVEELRQRSAALEEANRELQRVGRYRSLFLARMSHELRTPLTSILGFTEILIDQERLTERQRRFCEKIQSSGFQLQASLNQLVDLSRLEAGQTELFLHEFSLREMLRESCSAVSRLAQKQEVKLECSTAQEVGSIVSDEGKLRQVLYNFLAHAIGRSPEGGRVNVYAAPEESNRVRIEIGDEGEPLHDPAHLFDPADIDAPNERGTNMNELGLVIAYRLLNVLGGSVTLRDLEPAGLAVHLNLPARPTENVI